MIAHVDVAERVVAGPAAHRPALERGTHVVGVVLRAAIERATPQELQECLRHAIQQAGAPTLMTPEVIAAICDHAQGNPRALMIMAGELLEAAAQRDARQIDETLFFETCAVPAAREIKAATRRRR